MARLLSVRVCFSLPMVVLVAVSLPLVAFGGSGQGRTVMMLDSPQAVDGLEHIQADDCPEPGTVDLCMDYGNVLVGSTRTLGALLKNIGEGDITNIVVGNITGNDPDRFEITQDECTGETLAPQEDCLIVVRFAPIAVGIFNAEIFIESSADNSPEHLFLTGRGFVDEVFRDRFEESAAPASLQ